MITSVVHPFLTWKEHNDGPTLALSGTYDISPLHVRVEHNILTEKFFLKWCFSKDQNCQLRNVEFHNIFQFLKGKPKKKCNLNQILQNIFHLKI